MAPVLSEEKPLTPVRDILPKLHLRLLDLAHPGIEAFFRAAPSPGETLRIAVKRVLSTLYPPSLASTSAASAAAPPPVRSVTLNVRTFDGVAHTCGSELDNEHKEVHLSASYLAGVSSRCGGNVKEVKHELEGVLTHELVHVFQYDGRGSVPGGVIEGIADWVRGESGLGAQHWHEKVEEGDRWDAGYEKTGFFLRWLSSTLDNPHLVPQLNMGMRSSRWDDGVHLKKLLGGQDVEELWQLYREELEKRDQAEEAKAFQPVPTHGASKGYNVQY
ncbi:hypothetical protein JCM10213_005111 [Rhodosporidiobolus nylandii]